MELRTLTTGKKERETNCFESLKTMACGINKNCSVKLHVKICANGRQYYKHNCTSFFVRHCDIPRRFFMHSASSNSIEKRSLNLGLKNIMIYVMTFLVMTGKKHNKNYKLLKKNIIYIIITTNQIYCLYFAYLRKLVFEFF